MKRLGFAQIPLMIALLLMALAVPVATKLVQNNQDTRNKAAHSCVGEGGPVYSGSGSCCENLEMGDCAGSGSFKVCYCKKKATNPTVTPAYRNCTTWTWSNNVCTKSEYQRASNLACLPSNCTVNDPTPKPTTTPTGATETCTPKGATKCVTEGNNKYVYKCLDSSYYTGLRWQKDSFCGTSSGSCSNGACVAATPVPLRNECRSGDTCVSGMAGSCPNGSTYGSGSCDYTRILGSPQNGVCCTGNRLTPTPAPETCTPKGATKCVTQGNDQYVYKCLDSSYYTGLRWQKDSFCGLGCTNGACRVQPTVTPIPLRSCRSGDTCVSGMAGSCPNGSTYGSGSCDYTRILGSPQNGVCCTGNRLTPTPAPETCTPKGATKCVTEGNNKYVYKCLDSSYYTGLRWQKDSFCGTSAGSCSNGSCVTAPTVTPANCISDGTKCGAEGGLTTCNRCCSGTTYKIGTYNYCGNNNNCAGDGETAYSGHSCCAGLEQYDCVANGSFSTCKCRVKPANPTVTPAYRNCTTRTWNGNKCEVRTYQRASNLACDPSNCSPADPTPTTIPGRCTQGAKRCNSASSAFETCILVGTGNSAVTNWEGVYCRYNCNSLGCNTGPSITPTTPAGTARCCPKVDTTYAINTCTGASQNACGINSNYCEWKANGNCSITIPIVTIPPQTCCNTCPGGTCNGSKSGDTWLHLDDACSAACICGTYHQTDNGNYACGPGRIDEPTVTPAPPTPTSAICMTPIGAKATPTVIQGTCSGNRPADVCGNTNLKVSAQCYNGSWDYDEQLCNSKGRVEFCGGKTYCCPSNGGNWTNDMTNCSQPCGACTQCPNDALAKGKGDADCSGSVTINDASVWRAEFISGLFGTVSKTTWEADFDCDGKVTLNDISIWRSNFIKSLNN